MLNQPASIKPPIMAGVQWFALMFGLGFVLGTIRVLVTAPRFGDLAGVLLELPLMLGAGWVSCRWLIARHQIGSNLRSRSVLGLTFFTLLFSAEWLLGRYGFGRGAAEQMAAMLTLPGLIGLAAQLLTAGIPLWQGRHSD